MVKNFNNGTGKAEIRSQYFDAFGKAIDMVSKSFKWASPIDSRTS